MEGSAVLLQGSREWMAQILTIAVKTVAEDSYSYTLLY